jgi:hypothetical protein
VALLSPSSIFAQNISINEFMSNNDKTIPDSNEEFGDWIELYNPNSYPINLANYSLSDDSGNLYKWTFPSVTIFPDSFILVFTSGKNIVDSTELHTNCKINSDGERLFLSNNSGVLIDQIESVNLSEDESYGRVIDGDNYKSILSIPSPNQSKEW